MDINLSASLKDLTVFYGGLSVHGGCLRYEGICQIQNRSDFLKGENLSFYVDISLSASFKHLKLMPEPRNGFIYVCYFLFTLYSAALFPLKTPPTLQYFTEC